MWAGTFSDLMAVCGLYVRCFLQPALCTMAVHMTQCHLGDTQDDIRIRFNRLAIFSWLTVTHTMPCLGIAVVGKNFA